MPSSTGEKRVIGRNKKCRKNLRRVRSNLHFGLVPLCCYYVAGWMLLTSKLGESRPVNYIIAPNAEGLAGGVKN